MSKNVTQVSLLKIHDVKKREYHNVVMPYDLVMTNLIYFFYFFYNNSQMYKWQMGKQGMHFIELPYILKVVVKKHECKKILSIS